MSTDVRTDPYKNFRFRLEIEGVVHGGFSECSGLGSKIDVISYREGGDPVVRKLPGQISYSDITLKWGLTDSREVYNWHLSAINGEVVRRNCSIIILDDTSTEKMRWNVYQAWPSAWTGPSLNAAGKDVAIEQITLTCERFERV
jgi:phage tail-like protein